MAVRARPSLAKRGIMESVAQVENPSTKLLFKGFVVGSSNNKHGTRGNKMDFSWTWKEKRKKDKLMQKRVRTKLILFLHNITKEGTQPSKVRPALSS